MNINARIVGDTMEAPTISSGAEEENANHLLQNHHDFVPVINIKDMRRMTEQQKLMFLFYWIQDGYGGANLTREQEELLRNPGSVIKERILKENKESMGVKLLLKSLNARSKVDPKEIDEILEEI